MLTKEVENALNEQISAELYSSNYYLSMASWCDKTGLKGSAKFFYDHSEEERKHMLKLFRYVNDAGGHAITPEAEKPTHHFESIPDIIKLTLEHEQSIPTSINKLVELCLHTKDYSTFNFLEWYVAEQHEEHRLFNLILDKINIIGVDGQGLFIIDEEIGKLKGKAK